MRKGLKAAWWTKDCNGLWAATVHRGHLEREARDWSAVSRTPGYGVQG